MTKKVTKSDILKKNLLEALKKNLGNVMASCSQVGCSRKTYYEYYNNDPEFKKDVDSIAEDALDFTEGKLFSLINDENPTAILFYLKTRGKHRGYVEKQEIESKNTNLNIEKEITDDTSEQDASRIYQEFMKNR